MVDLEAKNPQGTSAGIRGKTYLCWVISTLFDAGIMQEDRFDCDRSGELQRGVRSPPYTSLWCLRYSHFSPAPRPLYPAANLTVLQHQVPIGNNITLRAERGVKARKDIS